MKRNKNITIIKKAYRVWSYEIEDAYLLSCIQNERYYGKTPAVVIKQFIDEYGIDYDLTFSNCITRRIPEYDIISYNDGVKSHEGIREDIEEIIKKNERMNKIRNCEPNTLFYVQDARSYVGNAVVFWRNNRCGYTSDVDEALKLTREQILKEEWRETDRFIKSDIVEKSIKRYCNAEIANQFKSNII